MNDTVKFMGKDYPVRTVEIREYGTVTVSTETLEDELFKDDRYRGEEAQRVDEGIFFFDPDDRIKLPETELAAFLEEAVA